MSRSDVHFVCSETAAPPLSAAEDAVKKTGQRLRKLAALLHAISGFANHFLFDVDYFLDHCFKGREPNVLHLITKISE